MVYENVVNYCNENKLPIYEFEKMCNIGNGVVSAWKDGHSKPRLETLEKMEKSTGIPIAEWVRQNDS